MLIINADDWGRSQVETDAALACFRQGRITSVSAMVFMKDSERAASLAKEYGLDVGLHLNLSQRYESQAPIREMAGSHERIVRFMTSSKYAVLIYHPGLLGQFRDVYQSQLQEFLRLYGTPPSHVDGHQHRHLCANMLLNEIISTGQKVRRNFSFSAGEKNLLNRAYRRVVDRLLARKYGMTDYFFSLEQCLRFERLGHVASLARLENVELMTHPIKSKEYDFLMSERCLEIFQDIPKITYAQL